ncbi:hypothetical protein OCT51_08810 [Halomonas sp. LR3S48]|uniref:hypothetical protein n=1 Tax=Halomonas sp. LR3S48 TaxID=2982694 RepID=UPI0021E45CBA|nr:hypothetical protein [Halomonas sp. LR3S48]UYG05446.1 hypothetical protein OCT51_08810 [Halomonas sp. LR3S48]
MLDANRYRRIVLFFCLPWLLLGCSQRGTYEGLKHSNALECHQVPSSQREECFDRLPPDYDTYHRQREAVIGE